jgi:lipoprotein-releasing system ATP-binding protein
MSKTIFKLEQLNKYYKERKDKLHIIRDLEMDVKEGEFISILGMSGSGKSTLLNMMGLLDRPDSGNVIIDGENVSQLNEKERDRIKNQKIGFVFQFHYLLPEFTALENVMMPALVNNYKDKKNIKNRAEELLTKVGLGGRLYHKPNELSGGEKQRVAIARALMNSPKIILADEPTGNLDEETRENIHSILKQINRDNKQTIIVVTHSRELANISDRQLYLKKGKLEELW